MKLFAIALIALGFMTPISAYAGNHSNNGVEHSGQVCADNIRHRGLKGSDARAEWGKCKADPAGYLKDHPAA
jgi:hypothetical protein